MERQTSVLDWDTDDVYAWFCKLGLPQYEQQIKEHNITGDVLCLLDAESLKEIGISTVGQRLAILKAVYNLKIANNIPIEQDHYVPPCEPLVPAYRSNSNSYIAEVEERQERLSVDKLYELIREQNNKLKSLEEENHRLSDTLHSCMEDVTSIRNSQIIQPPKLNEGGSPVQRQGSLKWASFIKPSRSPTKAAAPPSQPDVVDSPQSSPNRAEYEFNAGSSRAGASSSTSDKSRQPFSSSTLANTPSTSSNLPPSSGSSQPLRPTRQDSSDNLKSFKVSLEDPAWKVLPAALKKYRIHNDKWENYAMFICYGSPGNRIERCLSYDEKPLLLFQKLKEAQKNPVFMLKHIKDIRSPIAVAQQKQAARKANEGSTSKSPPVTGSSSNGHGSESQRARPPMLQVNSNLNLTSIAPGMMTGIPNGQSGWPEAMSPAVENKDRSDDHLASTADSSKSHVNGSTPDGGSHAVAREIPPSTDGVSYAVAIYPYMAEQEDEFDVVVGDTFIILSRARGWWVVQRDPAGTGQVEPDVTKQGWVPAGCLLETKVPVAVAVAEARGHAASASDTPSSPADKTPILPLSILSTSFPGIALMDYKKKGEEELDLAKDDSLRVFKRYNHWSYAVKEDTGDRGWVPSWYIGKVPTQSGVPPTPSTSGAPHMGSAASIPIEGDSRYGDLSTSQQAQVSPMSSAFPLQPRATTVV
ncbi:hypothetical protein K474DRAFT_344864 [Panus rudis PR-1116 ss-1]|nr:hypothetical protein K474DRAFT_344864 [Panus rudis PR-1116 ss-1]